MKIVMYDNTESDVPITWPAASPITVMSTSLSTCLTDNVTAALVNMTVVRLTSDNGFCRTARCSLNDIHVTQASMKAIFCVTALGNEMVQFVWTWTARAWQWTRVSVQSAGTDMRTESIWSINMCHFCNVLVSEIANVYVRTCKLSRSNFYNKKWRNHTRDVIILTVILTARTFLFLSHHQLLETNRRTVAVLVLVLCSTQGQWRPQYDGRSVGPSWLSVPPPLTPRGHVTVTEQN